MGKSRKDYSNLEKELNNEWKLKQVDRVLTSTPIKEIITPTNNSISSELKLSAETIATFVNYLEKSELEYAYAKEQIELEQAKTQDLLHAIEFSDDYKKRCRLATELKNCRQRRRYYKDRLEELEPLVTVLQKEDIRKTKNIFSNVCGSIRKVECYHKNREYKPKIYDMEVIKNGHTKKQKD